METKDKVEILLHEYDTLRDEVVQRYNAIQQQISIFVLMIIGTLTILSTYSEQRWGWSLFLYLLLALGLCVFAFALRINHLDIQKINTRLRELEADINQLAGEQLLKWETYWSGAVTGYFNPFRRYPSSRIDDN